MRLWTERNLPSPSGNVRTVSQPGNGGEAQKKTTKLISVLPPPDMVYENRVEYTSGLVYRVPLVLVSKAEGVESP